MFFFNSILISSLKVIVATIGHDDKRIKQLTFSCKDNFLVLFTFKTALKNIIIITKATIFTLSQSFIKDLFLLPYYISSKNNNYIAY